MPFDESFWRGEREKLRAILVPVLREAAIDGAESSLDHLLEVAGFGVDWGLVNASVQEWVSQYGGTISGEVTDTSQRLVQRAINDWIDSGEPIDVLIDALRPAFGQTRARLIAVTEVTGAFHQGNMAVWKQSEIVDGWRFRNAQDDAVCAICSPLEGNEYPLEDQTDAPPIHGRCRCFSQPVVKEPS